MSNILERAQAISSQREGPDADANATVLDPDAYTQKRRLKDLFELRREVADIRLHAQAQISSPYHLDHEALTAYRVAMNAYLVEVEPLIRRYGGEDIWEESHLGTLTVSPPEGFTEDGTTPSIHNGQREIINPASETEIHFDGLQSILTEPNPLTATFEATVTERHKGEHKIRETKTVQIPDRILDRGYRTVNLFLAEQGLDLDPDDDNSDIIREFDQSGDEPSAEYAKGEYNGNPDL